MRAAITIITSAVVATALAMVAAFRWINRRYRNINRRPESSADDRVAD